MRHSLTFFPSVSAQICRIDLGIILDDSGSIKHWGFEEEKNFVRSVARQLHISSTNTRVSVMTFSTGPRMRIHFRDRAGQDKNSLHWALNGIRHGGMRDFYNMTHKSCSLISIFFLSDLISEF